MFNQRLSVPRPLIQLFTLGFLLALALGIHELSAWTAPTQTAPNCVGCTVPLHTGSGVQTKTGGLQASTLDIASSLSVGGVPTDGPYLIDMDAATPGATAGIRFPDGTVQTSAGGGGSLSAIRSYTTAGAHTWTKPAGLSYAVVEVWGGGAGGENGASAAGAGGSSSFGTHATANGGGVSAMTPSPGGAGTAGDIRLTGGSGGTASQGTADWHHGGNGGNAPRGGAGGGGGHGSGGDAGDGTAPGGGGGGMGRGGGGGANPGNGGGAGGYAMTRVSASSLGATVAITVGAGGYGANSATPNNAGNGAPGMVIVYEYQ